MNQTRGESPPAANPPAPSSPDLRIYLQQEFLRRCRTNPRYSLRAFARALKLESSYLSKILQGKREITTRLVSRVQDPLKLTAQQVELFSDRVHQAKRQKHSPEQILGLEQVTLDVHHIVADWYHFAILELTQVRGFRPEAAWIADRLGIAPATAQDALERLQRLKLYRVTDDGCQIRNLTTVGTAPTADAFRALQVGILNKAIEAIKNVPVQERDQTSITVATSSRMLPEIKDRIKKFRRELSVALSRVSDKDVVYQMSFSCFPISKVEPAPAYQAPILEGGLSA